MNRMTAAEAIALDEFVQGHVEGCGVHPSISEMTHKDILTAIAAHGSELKPSRWHIQRACRRHQIDYRTRSGPKGLPTDKRREAANARWHRWRDKVMADPVKREAYQARRRDKSAA